MPSCLPLVPGPGGAHISIHPLEALLPRGGSLKVNCSSSCSKNESLSLGLETQWQKVQLDSGQNWKLFELSNIEEDSSPLCYENCGEVQSLVSAKVLVYCEWHGWGREQGDPLGT